LNLMQWAPLIVLAVLCAAATWFDLVERRIPNWLCATAVISGLAAAFLQGGLGDMGNHALHMVIGLLGGMALFAVGGFGGGDAKFYAGVASWFALKQALLLLVCVALSGLLLLIVWFGYRRARGIPVRRVHETAFDGLPYGVAIGLGAMIAATV
jgi:prepilin peptidase CpaA